RVVARTDAHPADRQAELAGMEQLMEQLLARARVEAMQREACGVGERAAESEDRLPLLTWIDRDRIRIARSTGCLRPRQRRLPLVAFLAGRRPHRDRVAGGARARTRQADGDHTGGRGSQEVTAVAPRHERRAYPLPRTSCTSTTA